MIRNKDKYYQPAGIYNRLIAAILDFGLWIIVWFTLHHILVETEDINIKIIVWLDKLILPVIFIYYVLFEWLTGATPGKLVMKIKVKTPKKFKVSLFQTIVRNSLKPISLIPFFIGYLMILLRKDNRALHDLASNCQVVKLKKL